MAREMRERFGQHAFVRCACLLKLEILFYEKIESEHVCNYYTWYIAYQMFAWIGVQPCHSVGTDILHRMEAPTSVLRLSPPTSQRLRSLERGMSSLACSLIFSLLLQVSRVHGYGTPSTSVMTHGGRETAATKRQ